MHDRFGQLRECFEQKKEYFMINRTKIIAITLTGALAAAALTGCDGSSSSAAPSSVSTAAAESSASSAAVSSVVDNAENGTDTLDGIYSTLLEQDPISNHPCSALYSDLRNHVPYLWLHPVYSVRSPRRRLHWPVR